MDVRSERAGRLDEDKMHIEFQDGVHGSAFNVELEVKAPNEAFIGGASLERESSHFIRFRTALS